MNVHTAVAFGWGVLLAHYSWQTLIVLVTRAVDRIRQQPTSVSPSAVGTAWMMVKWAVYVLWIALGLWELRLPGWAMVIGFFLGWTAILVRQVRVTGSAPAPLNVSENGSR